MLLDTSVIIHLLSSTPEDPIVKAIVAARATGPTFASPIHLGEVADAIRRRGGPVDEAIQRALDLVELVPLDGKIAVEASALKQEARKRPQGRNFSLIDGVGLATARAKEVTLWTFDSDFEGFPDVTILNRTANPK